MNNEQNLNKVETRQLNIADVICRFSFEELQYMLVMLTEGQDKVNGSKAFEGFQNIKTQETIINKVRQKCWEYHQNGI